MMLLLLLALQVSSALAASDSPICSLADVIFVVDESGSVGYRNFRLQLDFIKDMVSSFIIGPDNTQVSVVTFNAMPYNEFFLNEYDNTDDILGAIDTIRYSWGGTAIHEGLDFVLLNTLLPENGARPDVPKVVVVFTDGYSDFDAANAAAIGLRSLGVIVIAVGVGSKVKIDLLNVIATDPDTKHVFLVGGYNLLTTIQDKVTHTACSRCTKYGSHWKESPVTNSCYRFANKELDCERSRDWCLHKSTEIDVPAPYPMLVRIETQAENDWIHDMIQSSKGNRWIGATTIIEESGNLTTLWDDCPLDYVHWTNWAPNEPSVFHDGEREECVYIIRKKKYLGKWNDAPKHNTLKFVCEIPLCAEADCYGTDTIKTRLPMVDACLVEDFNGSCDWGWNVKYFLGAEPNQMTCDEPCSGRFRMYM
ncbi:hypothetical protein ScPMuIL_011181 [Solemya velum]